MEKQVKHDFTAVKPEYIYNTENFKWYAKLNGAYSREYLIEILKSLNYSTDKR